MSTRPLNFRILTFFILLFAIFATAEAQDRPIKVELKEVDGKWQILRGGQPYYIKGVGGNKYLDQAVAYGANSIRTWGIEEAVAVLDDAHKRGLTVLFGLWVGVERQGFNYDDARAVKAQLARFTAVVEEYKDHPAILMWGIGNEADLFYNDFKVWDAINDIAEMIHEKDPNHPTMTVTAGFDVAEVQLIKERAPAIDVYGINTYGELIGVDKQVRAFGWEGPYVITEWGPNGHWEVPKTEWGAPVEQTSAEKAVSYKERYLKGILEDPAQCLGSYVFLWGQKQEKTPTWYGVFLEDGTETEVMDVLQEGWSGSMPDNQSPHITDITLDGKGRYDSSTIRSGKNYTAVASVTDPDGDNLRYEWVLMPESTDLSEGGDVQSVPVPVQIVRQKNPNENELTFQAPRSNGAYRLFAYIYDGNGNAATANIPFFVGQPPIN